MIQLKKYRLKAGMTQEDLADAVGVMTSTISRWETSRNYPTILRVEELAAILGVKPQQIAGWSE